MKEIDEKRKEIDLIDDGIADLYEKRLFAVREIGKIKKANGISVCDPLREEEIALRLVKGKSEEDARQIRRLYDAIFSSCREMQRGGYYLLGKTLSHSYSESIHALLGLDYSLFELPEDKVAEFIKNGDYFGLNVTIPYKKIAFSAVDERSEAALITGAVNTVVKKDGKIRGYNTDVFGLDYALKDVGIDLFDKRVLILGSGGAAASAKAVAERCGAKETGVVSRTGALNYGNCADFGAEIIINATPVGTTPFEDDCLIDPKDFPGLVGVFDMNYNPLKTELVLRAKEMGIKASGGLKMLVAQAVKAYSLWTGAAATEDDIENVYRRIKRQKTNVVIVGMPGAGKTETGRLLAKRSGREFFDSDEEYAKVYGKTPEDAIRTDGEDLFRKREEEIVAKLLLNRGAVISLGGGAVLSGKTARRIKRNGFVILINRPLGKLPESGRPLSENGRISRLFEQRREIYAAVKDAEIQNDGTVEEAVEKAGKICGYWL